MTCVLCQIPRTVTRMLDLLFEMVTYAYACLIVFLFVLFAGLVTFTILVEVFEWLCLVT